VLICNLGLAGAALVEAGEGAAIIPSYWNIDRRDPQLHVRRLVKPVAWLDLCQVRRSGRRLPAIAEEFTEFLKDFIGARAGKAGSL
jgi:LysR family transcriptional regulator, carnitine catabolism transcriptional activator